jgi:hypothetical protein
MKKRWVFAGILAMLLLMLVVPNNAFSKSAVNKAACMEWCKAHQPECIKCHPKKSCGGKNFKIIRSFRKGSGSWYACGLSDYRRGSLKNREECEKYCENNPDKCDFCWRRSDCKSGRQIQGERIRTFGGKGQNWYACRFTVKGLLTKERLEECKKMCESSDICDYCTTRSCDRGDKAVARFKGKGRTVRACQKR